MKVAIITPRLSHYDAVSNDALGQLHFLQSRDIECCIFAESFDNITGTRHIKELGQFLNKRDQSRQCIVYHYSTHWQAGDEAIKQYKAIKILKYHNITPGDFYKGYNTEYSDKCDQGRKALHQLIENGSCNFYLADSNFNSKELKNAGATEVTILPPFHQSGNLLATHANLDYLSNLQSADTTNVLMVGRIAPGKGLELLIRSFAIYHHTFSNNSRLLIVGKKDPNLDCYNRELDQIIDREKLAGSVNITGALTTDQLKACYLGSHLFCTTSEHEGFCVPILEAQALNIPILALDRGALAETIANGGLVWQEPNPELFAASIHHITTNPAFYSAIVHTGQKNYQDRFNEAILQRKFKDYLKTINIIK